eukprot:218914_1
MDKMVLTMYLTTTFVAASEGVIVGALFQPGSSNEEEVATLGAADAVFCMIASQIAKVDNYGDIVSKCSLFTFMFLCTALIHWLVFYPAGFFDLTGKNAYKWYANVPKALMMAFATDGSVAALPNTIAENVQNNGVREDVARFVLPLGATLNMDGSAIYYSMAYILYANYTGQSDALTMGAYITIAIVSSFLSIGGHRNRSGFLSCSWTRSPTWMPTVTVTRRSCSVSGRHWRGTTARDRSRRCAPFPDESRAVL